MIRALVGAVLLLGLAGCTHDLAELAKDPAPLCVTVNSIYEHIEVNRLHGCDKP